MANISRFQRKQPPTIVEPEQDIGVKTIQQEKERLKHFGNIEFGDIDKLLETTESQMPYYDSERLYLYELDSQQKVWSLILIIAIMMIILSSLLGFGG